MDRLVFRDDMIGTIFTSIIILGLSGFFVYNMIATQNYLNIIPVILPLLLFIPIYKRRIVIENGTLYFKKNIVPLEKVTEINMNKVSETTAHGRKSVKHIFLMDQENNILVHFHKDYMKGNKRGRFLDALKKANPGIKIHIE